MNGISDSDSRMRALDPACSFIVQAPAGSGKTELLIQRYLKLLATVDEPEQIIAITFTRKAAAEMRERILAALREAAERVDVSAPHKQLTRELAEAALARDEKRGWSIRADSRRMRIGTLDSFNSTLAMHLPLLAGGAAGAEICDDASVFYRESARRTVESVWRGGEDVASKAIVLEELDFDAVAAERMIAGMLAVREQWIDWFLDADLSADSAAGALSALAQAHASRISELLADSQRAALVRLTRHASEHGSEQVRSITQGINSIDEAERQRAVAGLVLTKEGAWRRRFTKTQGFGPEFKAEKDELSELLGTLAKNEDLAPALFALSQLPAGQYSISDKSLLQAVAELLAHAVAELRLLFAQSRQIDFTELSLAARQAIGHVDAPSDLLLALDQRVQHILVDEFQDTSLAQNRLLETLTGGWLPDDGRSLFLVGDPMQSIYRFRNADMSLFISARKFGIGDISCTPLELRANFRSAPAIVDWVNEAFAQCFPATDDLQQGVAAFRPGAAVRSPGADEFVTAHALPSSKLADEHAAVLEIIAQERAAHPNSHIAILVRSRSHLAGFQALLREHGWHARAVEIDAPYAAQLTQDLIGIARALTHFGDRIAWLAQLRAPWCGLEWRELELLVGDDPQITVWEAMHDEARLGRLAADTRQRLYGLRDVFQSAIARRARLPFVDWLEETWRSLGGHTVGAAPCDEHELDELFRIFEQAAAGQDVTDVAELETFFRDPLKQEDRSEPGIDIMTIHRAKGLEFDCVILPGLARTPRGEDKRLLEWFDVFDTDGSRTRIAAPYSQGGSELVNWIRSRNRERSRAETARLLYVAATRAKQRLHLVWGRDDEERAPPDASLLRPVWPILETTPVSMPAPVNETDELLRVPLRRRRSPLCMSAVVEQDTCDERAYTWTSGTAASVGTVVHQWLQRLSENPAQEWGTDQVEAAREDFAARLELLGVARSELSGAVQNVVRALQGVLEDDRGRWIIGAREQAESELMLSSIVNGQVVHQRLDRTFVEDGVRWIIDYKTAVCREDDVEAFLDHEVKRYRGQLEGYARFMARQDSRPIRLALYFPMLPALREWPAEI